MSPDPSIAPEQIARLLSIGLEVGPVPAWRDEIRELPKWGSGPGAGVGPVAGTTIGRYRLVEVIGEGGFGVVWRAEQTGPLHREVALKLIKPRVESLEILGRFESERHALSLMEHPNIAAVLDAGTTTEGQPYFVMELVRGRPVTAYCDEKRLTIRERLELFLTICHAVQHAHQKAILHCDLKPSNILVIEVDGHPMPKIIDFGVAKALASSPEDVLEASLMRSMEGMIVGTPQYMSPEQAGSMPDVDTRSDICTLGIILHELLTGSPPLTRTEVKGMPLDRVLAKVRDHDIAAPSSRFMTVTEKSTAAAEARQADVFALRRQVKGELDWVVLKGVEADRERRYQTVAGLAADVRRHLDGEAVTAGQPGRLYRMRRFVRRHRPAVLAGSAVFIALVAGGSVAAGHYVKERSALTQILAARGRTAAAETAIAAEAGRSLRISDFLLKTIRNIKPGIAQGRDLSVLRDVLVVVDRRRRKVFAADPGTNAQVAYALASALKELSSPRECIDAYADALRLLTEAGKGESAEAAQCLHAMAMALMSYSGRIGNKPNRPTDLKQVAEWHRQCLEIRRKVLPANDHDSIRTMLDYGEILSQLGEGEPGQKLLEDATRMAEQSGESRSLARAYTIRAAAAQTLGELAKAQDLAEEALRIRQSKLMKDDAAYYPGLADSWRQLFAIHRLRKNFSAAEDAARHMLECRKLHLGYEPSGPLTNIAIVRMEKGDREGAKAAVRRALESAALHERRHYPAYTVRALVNLLEDTNDRAGARKFLRDVVAHLDQTPDADPGDLKYAVDRLAEVGAELP